MSSYRQKLCVGLLASTIAQACSGNDDSSASGTGGTDTCRWTDAGSPEYLSHVGCKSDFDALSSAPLDESLPGATSTKVIQDHANSDEITFQNSTLYTIHYDFASTHLSGGDLPVVPDLATFNSTEYFSPERRFSLGAVTYYEEPNVWALEIAPYDTASADMITTLFRGVRDETYLGSSLKFHPTSDAVAAEAAKLPSDIPVVTTDELYAATTYQPLSLGSGVGRLRFLLASQLETSTFSYQDILVLDQAPNDISVVQGLITEEFQTPLSHVNVLSKNRHTPNMGLRGATNDAVLRSFEGKLIRLEVGVESWDMREVSEEEAEEYWASHKPEPVTLPSMDLSVTDLVDIEDVTPEPTGSESLRDAIKESVRAFGGKAAQYSILARTDDVPCLKAFAVPIYYYDKFMADNGFYDRVAMLLDDDAFLSDSAVRDEKLKTLRDDMMVATIDADFQAALQDKLESDYPGLKMRFRTSTNSEDLDGFPCAGCYESHSGDPADWDSVLDAIRETYASTWLFRTFEERSYYGVAHDSVGMALLVHHNFAEEEANGVAVTNNPFDPSGLQPAFYVNVQLGGDVEVVAPPPGVSSDQFLYYFAQPNQPTSYIAHSSLIPQGQTVLDAEQVHSLGVALDAIQDRFSAAYGPAAGVTSWYGMDVEFKFDDEADPTKKATLYVKQARPYPSVSP